MCGTWVGLAVHDPLSSPGRGVWRLCSLRWAQASPVYPSKVLSPSRTTVGKGWGGEWLPLPLLSQHQRATPFPAASPHTPAAPIFKGSRKNTGPGGRGQASGLGFTKDNRCDLGQVPEPLHTLYRSVGMINAHLTCLKGLRREAVGKYFEKNKSPR